MNVLLGTDGSRETHAAAEWLAALPFQKDSLDILAVIRHHRPHGNEGAEAVDPAALHGTHDASVWADTQDMAERLRPAFRDVQTHLRGGDPVAEILAQARARETGLIVLGHRDRSIVAARLLGSVARGVLERAECPVLLVRPEWRPPHRVLLAYDGSPAARAGLDGLLMLPLPGDATVTVVCIAEAIAPVTAVTDAYGGLAYAPPEYYEALMEEETRRRTAAETCAGEATQQIAKRGWKTAQRTPCARAAEAILAAAKEADLVVLGAHTRREWIEEIFLGNTALEVLHHAPGTILVGHGKARTERPSPEEAQPVTPAEPTAG